MCDGVKAENSMPSIRLCKAIATCGIRVCACVCVLCLCLCSYSFVSVPIVRINDREPSVAVENADNMWP